MGYFDMPAVSDYIREATSQQKMAYIGHSQGTTQMFAALAKDPEYWKERISAFMVMAPGLVPTRDNLEI